MFSNTKGTPTVTMLVVGLVALEVAMVHAVAVSVEVFHGGDVPLGLLDQPRPPHGWAPIGSDPTCQTGIRLGNACCSKQCGRCGGTGCQDHPGGIDMWSLARCQHRLITPSQLTYAHVPHLFHHLCKRAQFFGGCT